MRRSDPEITQIKEGVLRTRPPLFEGGGIQYVTGALLTMGDGTRWFHPYNGGQPVQETAQ